MVISEIIYSSKLSFVWRIKCHLPGIISQRAYFSNETSDVDNTFCCEVLTKPWVLADDWSVWSNTDCIGYVPSTHFQPLLFVNPTQKSPAVSIDTNESKPEMMYIQMQMLI